MERIVQQSDGLNIYQSTTPFQFMNGESIDHLVLAFETYGEMNEDKSNIVLIHHAFSTHSHVSSHAQNKNNGWWENMVGDGFHIDTSKYFVICINNLGSCFGSSSPAGINPITHEPYQCNFPVFTFEDVVNSQKQLFDFLKIEKIHTIIGPSLGGMISLTWVVKYPEMVERMITISSAARAYTANNANRAIQREIIMLDPEWNGGHYARNPQKGLNTARKLGLYTYRSSKEFNERFHLEYTEDKPIKLRGKREEIENYLEYNANKFSSNFDTNCYLYTLQMMDLYDIRNGYNSFGEAFYNLKTKVLVISVNTDRLFAEEQQFEIYQEMKKAGVDVSYIPHESEQGHDTFLIETDLMGTYIQEFLEKGK